jgi:aerobic-type carbon monoxide dehydrogenase small subunit (CoxS/CutS family)
MMNPTIDLTLTVNGQRVSREQVSADLPLLDFLQEKMALTGTKFGCGIGVCRACTVVLERVAGAPPVPVLACSTPVSEVQGQAITTVEGLGSPEHLHPLQQAFLAHFAFQCGYCTPGFLMAAYCMLERLRHSPVTKAELDRTIHEACGAHICRCTGYVQYYQAIRKVALAMPGAVR